MSSIISDKDQPLEFKMNQTPAAQFGELESPIIDTMGKGENIKIEEITFNRDIDEAKGGHSLTPRNNSRYPNDGPPVASGEAMKPTKLESEAEPANLPYPSSNQATEGGSKAESGAPSSSYPSHHQSHTGQHHSSYAQYYQYPHGHTPYYYPPGPYYPPPPPHNGHSTHSGHQSYTHAPHHPHYYAHYPPPPGYYPPPYHYPHYGQPPAAASPSDNAAKGKSVSPSISPSSSKGSTKDSSSPSSTQLGSKSISKRPYSAFSTNGTSSSIKISSSSPESKSTQKVKQEPTSSSKKRKSPIADSNTIFRPSTTKRSSTMGANSKAVVAAIAAKRQKTKEKAEEELSKTVLDRRARKNAQSRLRASRLKKRIADIQAMDEKDRTPEEVAILGVFEERRQRKNGRSRERAMERKSEYDRIMALPESEWTSEQRKFVQETVIAKFKKNEGDRLRRKKLKEDFDSNGSISSGWEDSTCKGSVTKKTKEVSRRKSTKNSRIPDFIGSSNGEEIQNTEEQATTNVSLHYKDAPLTPLSQQEAYSLLESTPTNFFGNTLDPSMSKSTNGNCFSPNFIFPSPKATTTKQDLSANMDVIDFDSLELPMDGTSILDPSMAMTIGDEVLYSPHLQPPTINENERVDYGIKPSGEHSIPQLSSSMRLSPLNLPRRNRRTGNFTRIERGSSGSCTGSESDSLEIPGKMSNFESNSESKAIAVSFSVDTA
jgi:hypothetical protein